MLFCCLAANAQSLSQLIVVFDQNSKSSLTAKETLQELFTTNNITTDFYQIDQLNHGALTELNDNPDSIVITIGRKAFVKSWQNLNNTRIFSLLLSKPSIYGIIEDTANKNILSGLYLEQPVVKQIELAQHIMPNVRKVGFLITDKNYIALNKELSRLNSNINFQIKTVSDQKTLSTALSQIVRNTDLLVTQPEPKIYNSTSLKNILLSSYRNNVPVIGLNKSFVNAGCLASIYTTIEQLGAEAFELLDLALRNNKLPEIQYSSNFTVSINYKVANSLGLYVPSESQILERMR